MSYEFIRDYDTELYDAMENELQRQRDHIELIASENFTSRAVPYQANLAVFRRAVPLCRQWAAI